VRTLPMAPAVVYEGSLRGILVARLRRLLVHCTRSASVSSNKKII